MTLGYFHPNVQQAAMSEAAARNLARDRAKLVANPVVAESVSKISTRGKSLTPTTALALARANASAAAVDYANANATRLVMTTPDDPGNFYERNFFNPFKKAVRYTVAALDLVPELVQNLGSQIAGSARGGGIGFQATTLGTMLSNPDLQGEGYFAGDDLRKEQGERARKFRGTTKAGNAWSIGRAGADIFFEPKSIAYNAVSGFIDAAVMLVTDPTNLIGGAYAKAAKQAAQIPDAAKALVQIGEIDQSILRQANELMAKALDEAEITGGAVPRFEDVVGSLGNIKLNDVNKVWDESAFGRWFDHNKFARRINKRVSKVVAGVTKRLERDLAEELPQVKGMTKEIKYILPASKKAGKVDQPAREYLYTSTDALSRRLEEAQNSIRAATFYLNRRVFKGRMDHRVLERIMPKIGIDEDGRAFVVQGERFKNIFGESAARLAPDGRTSLLPTDVRRIAGASMLRGVAENPEDSYRVSRLRNWFQESAGSKLLVRGSQMDRFNAVRNIENLVKSIKTISPKIREQVVGRAVYAYNVMGRGSPAEIKDVQNLVMGVVREALIDAGAPDAAITKVMKNYDEGIKKLRASVATVLGERNGHNYVRSLVNSGVLDEGEIVKALSRSGVAVNSLDEVDLMAHSAMISSELLNQVQVLPDPRVIKRLTKNPWWQKTIQKGYIKKTGELRGPFLAAEVLQNEIWKPLALMQPAYLLRNLIDGQFHVYLAAQHGIKGIFRNPWAFFSYVAGNPNAKYLKGMRRKLTRGAVGIEGETFIDSAAEILGTGAREIGASEAWARSMATNSNYIVGDAADAVRRAAPGFVKVSRVNQPQQHTIGLLDQLRLLYTAPEVQWALQRSAAVSIDSARPEGFKGARPWISRMMELLNNPKHADLRERVLSAAQGFSYGTDYNKVPIRLNPSRMTPRFMDPVAIRAQEDMLLEHYLSDQIGGYIDKFDGIPEMWVMAGFNRVPIVPADGNRAIITTAQMSDIADAAKAGHVTSTIDDTIGVGTIIDGDAAEAILKLGEPGISSDLAGDALAWDWIITNVRTDDAGRRVAELMPLHKVDPAGGRRGEYYTAFRTRAIGRDIRSEDYSNAAIDVVNKLASNVDEGGAGLTAKGIIPAETGYMIRLGDNDAQGLEAMNRWRDFVDTAFGLVAGKTMDMFEKSPLFRQYYYNYVVENSELLSPDAYRQMLDNIETYAQKLGVEPWQIVGDRRNYGRLKEGISNAKGVGTVDQLSQFAGNQAMFDIKELLFDHAQKSNIEDALRVIAPFAGAWREVGRKYARQLAENPLNLRKIQRSFVGLTKVDVNADGNGFFEKDPQTGQYAFHLPFSDYLSKATTGLYAPLVAPVRGLSMGLNILPALGPVAQMPANEILRFVPKENDFRQVLLPYGSEGVKTFIPGWARKTFDAIRANPEILDSFYGQTYVETVRALGAQGNYDLTDKDEREQMFQDAHGKARILTIFRALSQAIGPASGTVKFEISTKQGDVYIQHLIKAFQDLQQEDYETAVPRFIEAFGDQALLYVSGKSKNLVGGLAPTEAYDEWAKQNKDLMNKFQGVAGFMAPGGDEFSFLVWKKQAERGERQRLSAREIVNQAENMMGASLFRAQRIKYGAFPTEEQRMFLRALRAKLHERYPGFPPVADFNTGEFDTFVLGLRELVAQPSMENNQAAIATRIYLEKRDQVFAQAQAAGLVTIRSKVATPLRDYLATLGQALVQRYPDFERVYEQKLQAELMQYEEN